MLRTAALRGAVAGWLLLCAACARPTLWLGELGSDAGRDAPEVGLPDARPQETDAEAPRSDAGAGQPAAQGGGAAPAKPDAGPDVLDAATPPPSAPGVWREDAGAPDDMDGGGTIGDVAPRPTELPRLVGSCPDLSASGRFTFGDARRNLTVRIDVAPEARRKPAPGGPLILYWHSFGSDEDEVTQALGEEVIADVVQRGGVVASFASKFCATCGILPDDVAWYVEDDIVSDHVVACAVQQARIDTRHIHSIGFSAGAIHTMHLALARSNFIASVVSYSGGDPALTVGRRQDPTNKVPAILLYGGSRDVLVFDFGVLARRWHENYTPLGWYSMLCEHDGGHAIPPGFGPSAYQFFLDHPYKVDPEPYAGGIPSSFPSYCGDER